MTTPTTGIETAPRGKTRSTTREEALHHVQVTLFWRGEASWASCPSEGAFRFRCLGMRFGSGRWKLHLAETDRQLPGMSTAQRRELTGALREALATSTGLAVVSFPNDLILEPACALPLASLERRQIGMETTTVSHHA